MRICIFGGGAIGGFMAARLASAGHSVTLIARGPQLEAIRAHGLVLQAASERLHVQVDAFHDPAEAGPQDLVIITVKAPSLGEVARGLAPLLGSDTPIIVAMNGIPWWFMDSLPGTRCRKLESADPDGVLAAAFPADRLIGCVLHIGCSVPEPGTVVHHGQNRFLVGAPDADAQALVAPIVATLSAAEIGAEAVDDVRTAVWQKLLGNLNFAPVSLLTRATNDRIAADPGLRRICIKMFEEADRVGQRFGLAAGLTAEERVELGGSFVGFKTSMLQDLERARTVELEVIVGAVMEMGDIAGINTPIIDAVHALAFRAAREAGCFGGAT